MIEAQGQAGRVVALARPTGVIYPRADGEHEEEACYWVELESDRSQHFINTGWLVPINQ